MTATAAGIRFSVLDGPPADADLGIFSGDSSAARAMRRLQEQVQQLLPASMRGRPVDSMTPMQQALLFVNPWMRRAAFNSARADALAKVRSVRECRARYVDSEPRDHRWMEDLHPPPTQAPISSPIASNAPPSPWGATSPRSPEGECRVMTLAVQDREEHAAA